jgi:hypothetical protein
MFTGLDPMIGQSAGNGTTNVGFSGTYAGTAPATFSALGASVESTAAPFILIATA